MGQVNEAINRRFRRSAHAFGYIRPGPRARGGDKGPPTRDRTNRRGHSKSAYHSAYSDPSFITRSQGYRVNVVESGVSFFIKLGN